MTETELWFSISKRFLVVLSFSLVQVYNTKKYNIDY